MADTAQMTLLQVGGGGVAAEEGFTTLAGVTGISGPSLSNPTVDATTLSDTSRQKISSELLDAGQVTLEVLFDANTTSDQNALVDKVIAGSAASNYQICFSNLDDLDATVLAVDAGDDELDFVDDPHVLRTGQPIRIKTDSADLPEPLVTNTTYYARYVDSDSIQLATTNANAIAGTTIDITDAGTGTHTVTHGTCYRFSARVSDCQVTSATAEAITATLTLDIDGTVTIQQAAV